MLKTMTVRTTIAAILTGLSMSAHAIADTARAINIPASDLVVALESLAKQADIELVYQAEQLRGIRTGGVSGTYEPKEAVSLLLKGTQLTIRTDEATGVMLVAPPAAPRASTVAPSSLGGQVHGEQKKSFWSRIRLAQSETPSASQGESVLSEIVVTGSRIIRDGYQAPIPTTVLGAEALAAKAPVNIADFVNELPAFAGSVTPTTATQALSAGGVGINALNLRNLGANRTLVLLDGQRVGASTLSGWVDVNQFPQALVKRVEVVTGGASADWGSDAIAGVVNFILDKEFTGIKGNVQGGVTTYGDNENYNLSLAAGTGFADGTRPCPVQRGICRRRRDHRSGRPQVVQRRQDILQSRIHRQQRATATHQQSSRRLCHRNSGRHHHLRTVARHLLRRGWRSWTARLWAGRRQLHAGRSVAVRRLLDDGESCSEVGAWQCLRPC